MAISSKQQKSTPKAEWRIVNVIAFFLILCAVFTARHVRMLLQLQHSTNPSTYFKFHAPTLSQQQGAAAASSSNEIAKRKWAYVYLMAGVDVKNPGYKGIFYNVLVSAELLKDSKADILVMVQMSYQSESSKLTAEEEHLLEAMNVKIMYLDLPIHQNLYSIQYEKFRILDLLEYSRVIYMDGDAIPFCPMDYLFNLSEPLEGKPLLKENLLLAWRAEPAMGSFFMLQPKKGDHKLIQDIIAKREEEGMNSKELFNNVTGWGHVIKPPDRWKSLTATEGRNATLWSWHGDFVDQGLLYYWAKYYKKSVSLVIGMQIENWSSSKNGEAVFETKMWGDPLKAFGCVPYENKTVPLYASDRYSNALPYRDFTHFSGPQKPWLNQPDMSIKRLEQVPDENQYWFFIFRKVKERLHMDVDIEHLDIPRATFGLYPTHRMMRDSINAKQIARE